MTITKQVCSVEYAIKLKELGIKQELSNWFWYTGDTAINQDHLCTTTKHTKFDLMSFATFTVAELGAMLPSQSHRIWKRDDYFEFTLGTSDWKDWQKFPTEADARASMLVQLIERGDLKVEDCNKKLND